jgi:hypothetical protein
MSLKVQLNLEIGDLVTCRQEMVKVRWSVSPHDNKWTAGEYYNWYYSNQPDEGLEKITA